MTRADLAGGADDADVQTRRSSPGPAVDHGLDLVGVQVERGVRRRAPRRRRSASSTTTEIRISEVEIISMLTPAVGQRGEELGGDARVRPHAGADQRDLADLVVVEQRRRSRPRP